MHNSGGSLVVRQVERGQAGRWRAGAETVNYENLSLNIGKVPKKGGMECEGLCELQKG